MKKILIFAGIFILSGLLFTGFSPSVDGRDKKKKKGELPSGLFGKTVGYLPGDSVSVVNPANGKTVDILVLGSLDPSQGVAILLSPEAAAELNIEKNVNNLVKLTKRTGKLDEQVYGRATIAKDEMAEKPLFEETSENAEAARSLGMTFSQIISKIVIPQAVRSSILHLTNLLVATMLTTALASQVPLSPLDLTGLVAHINSHVTGGIMAFAISAFLYCATAVVIGQTGNYIDRKVRIFR